MGELVTERLIEISNNCLFITNLITAHVLFFSVTFIDYKNRKLDIYVIRLKPNSKTNY